MRTFFKLGLALGITLLGLKSPTLAQSEKPYLLKHSLNASASISPLYQPPGAKEPKTNFTNWLPYLEFEVQGPLPNGSELFADFYKPDGKLWLTQKMYAGMDFSGLQTGEAHQFQSERATPTQEHLGQIQGGQYPFKIRAKSPQGADIVLFSGRMKVQKVHSGIPGGNFTNYFIFYNDYDWLAPVGYISQDVISDKYMPQLQFSVWLKGQNQETTNISAALFYNGQQIAHTTAKDADGYEQGVASELTSLRPGEQVRNQEDVLKWGFWQFSFYKVFGYYQNENNEPPPQDAFIIAANPGSYEFKVFRDSTLVRSAKFEVQANGYVKQTGFIELNYAMEAMSGNTEKANSLMYLPITVHGTKDGKIDPNAYKTEAFFGNP